MPYALGALRTTTGYHIPYDRELFFGINLFVESDLLLKGKIALRFPASSFADLTARGRALLTEMAIRARMFLGTSFAARGVEKALVLGEALECLFGVGHPFPPKNNLFRNSH